MVLPLDVGSTSVGAGGQVSKHPSGDWIGHAFGALGAEKSCRRVGCQMVVLRTDGMRY